MPCRRKKDPPPPRSSSWESYRPDEDLYWRLGGPTVPIDQIPPASYTHGAFGTAMSVKARIKWLAELTEKAETDLAGSIAYYLKLDELGIDAMTMQFYRDEDRKLEAEGDRRSMVARNVDRHRASCYRTIAMNRCKLAAYRQQLAALEVAHLPLFQGRG